MKFSNGSPGRSTTPWPLTIRAFGSKQFNMTSPDPSVTDHGCGVSLGICVCWGWINRGCTQRQSRECRVSSVKLPVYICLLVHILPYSICSIFSAYCFVPISFATVYDPEFIVRRRTWRFHICFLYISLSFLRHHQFLDFIKTNVSTRGIYTFKVINNLACKRD